MDNASALAPNLIDCKLVNHFEHEHEREQYKEIRGILTSGRQGIGHRGVLLGNVMCGSASLDSLLLTEFGVFIIEFKSYPNVRTVKVNGQREFVCYDKSGSIMKDGSGNILTVKGGCQSSPFDQARINRRIVREKLISVFGESVGKAIHIGVIIVFRGDTQIQGIDEFTAKELEWLTIINTANLIPFLSIASERRTKGLDTLLQKELITRMDANRDLFGSDSPSSVETVVPSSRSTTQGMSDIELYEIFSNVSEPAYKKSSSVSIDTSIVVRKRLIDNAYRKYCIAGRVASTATFLVFIIFQASMLFFEKWMEWGLISSCIGLFVLAILIRWCYGEDDFDRWFIRSYPHNHTYDLTFRTIEVRSREWNFSRTALVVSYVFVFLAILALPYIGLNHLVNKGMDYLSTTSAGNSVIWYVYGLLNVELFVLIKIFMWTYFVFQYAGYVWAIVMQVRNDDEPVCDTDRHGCSSYRYLIPVPEILHDGNLRLRCSIMLALRSLKYGVAVTGTLCVIRMIRPYLYAMFS